jgi:hypothetical protein
MPASAGSGLAASQLRLGEFRTESQLLVIFL